MRKTVLLLGSVALAVLLAAGVALAAEITCPTGENGLCVGTPEDDTMTGTDGFDKMYGEAGADTLYGKRWPDTLEGGAGNDIIYGQGSNPRLGNTLYGDSSTSETIRGNDRISGGPRDDRIYGGPGNDRVFGGPGDDDIVNYEREPGSNYDRVHGQDGYDFIIGDGGEYYGEGGNDFLAASDGDAFLYGGVGNDDLSVGSNDSNTVGYTHVANGGPGEDRFYNPSYNPEALHSPDDVTYLAVDGEHDFIHCYDVESETVRADPLDTFEEGTSGVRNQGRQYCDSLTIVEE